MRSTSHAGDRPPPEMSPSDRLDSWKEIAAHLRRAVRTVRRWEQAEGLPVHRHAHARRSSVYAYKTEIDAWWRSRQNDLDEDSPIEASLAERRWARRGSMAVIAVGVVSLALAGLIATRTLRSGNGTKASQVRSLTAYRGFETGPSFSPDGLHFAFAWNGEGQDNFDIYVRMVDETTCLRLTTNAQTDYNPVWSPDGRFIAFLRSREDSRADIILIPSLGGIERTIGVATPGNLNDSLLGWISHLAWSQDSRSLIFPDADPTTRSQSLFEISTATGEMRRIARTLEYSIGDDSPSVSPDGLAFVRSPTNAAGDIKGTNAVPLTPGLLYSGAPRWSPDGKMLAFGSVVKGNDDIFTVSADGGPIRRITEDSARDVVASWSQDGESIYFASNRTGTFEIWKTSRLGGPTRQITKAGGYGGFESVDGRHFYYAKSNSVPTSLWRVSAEGGDEQALLPSLHRWSHFAVFHDGIYFVPSVRPPASSELQFYDFAGRGIQTVASLQAHTAPGLAISPDRRFALYVVHERIASDLMLLESFQ